MSREEDLNDMAKLIRGFEELRAVPPFGLEVADALGDEDLHEAVLVTGRRLVYVQRALGEELP